jgi:hypothetical protein
MQYTHQGKNQRIELFISCRGLKNMDYFSKSDPVAILYEKNAQEQWIEKDRTETIDNNLNPNFSKTFIVEYVFEKQQHIKFEVNDVDGPRSFNFIGDCTTTLAKIMGSKSQMEILELFDRQKRNTGSLIVRAEKVGDNWDKLSFKIKCSKIPELYWLSKTSPFLRFYNCRDDYFWVKVFETINLPGNLNPTFPTIEITAQKLCHGKNKNPIKIELWDHQSSGSHEYIGECTFTLSEIFEEEKRSFPLKNTKNNKDAGILNFDEANKEEVPGFIDYIRGGLQLNLSLAIDFTGSNGDPSSPSSLHYLSKTKKNPYQEAIESVSQILINYDHDKEVPGNSLIHVF